jgi:hypothetical protein
MSTFQKAEAVCARSRLGGSAASARGRRCHFVYNQAGAKRGCRPIGCPASCQLRRRHPDLDSCATQPSRQRHVYTALSSHSVYSTATCSISTILTAYLDMLRPDKRPRPNASAQFVITNHPHPPSISISRCPSQVTHLHLRCSFSHSSHCIAISLP